MLNLTYEKYKHENGFVFVLNDSAIHDEILCQLLNLTKEEFMLILKQFNVKIAGDNNTIFYDKEDIENAIVTLKMLG